MFKFFAKGKRGVVYKGKYKGRYVVLKAESQDLRRINNEVFWLKRLNKFGIGPKLIFYGDGWFICEFVKGIPLNKWVENKTKVKKVLLQVLKEARVMDKSKVNKFEMHRPFKNILVYNNKPVMIDFERCKISLKPKNVSQFCNFVINALKLDRKDILKVLKEYTTNYSDESFENLVKKLKIKKELRYKLHYCNHLDKNKSPQL